MASHARQPEPRKEALLAVYSHAVSNPAAEWSYRHTEWYGAVTVFLLVLTCSVPHVAAALALVVAGGMVGVGVVLSRRDHGNCEQIIAEVQEREAEQ